MIKFIQLIIKEDQIMVAGTSVFSLLILIAGAIVIALAALLGIALVAGVIVGIVLAIVLPIRHAKKKKAEKAVQVDAEIAENA